jgi:hypothetical protein
VPTGSIIYYVEEVERLYTTYIETFELFLVAAPLWIQEKLKGRQHRTSRRPVKTSAMWID